MPAAIPDEFQDPIAELAKLANLLSSPSGRKAFYNNPEEAAERAAVNVGDTKVQQIIDTLSDLSLEELRLLSDLNDPEKWPLFVQFDPNPPKPLFVF